MRKILLLILLLIAFITANAQVPLAGYITTFGGTYPTHLDSLGMGGYMTTYNRTTRNAIPSLRRKVGMMVRYSSADSTFILSGGITNSNWVYFSTATVDLSPYAKLSGGNTFSGDQHFGLIDFYSSTGNIYSPGIITGADGVNTSSLGAETISTNTLAIHTPLTNAPPGSQIMVRDTSAGNAVRTINLDSILNARYMLLTGRNFADSAAVKWEYNNNISKDAYTKVDSNGVELGYIGLYNFAMLTINSNGVGVVGGLNTDSIKIDPFTTDHISQFTTEDPADPDNTNLGFRLLVLNTTLTNKFGKVQWTSLDTTFCGFNGRQFSSGGFAVTYNSGGMVNNLSVTNSDAQINSSNGLVGAAFTTTPSGVADTDADSISIHGRKIVINGTDTLKLKGGLGLKLESQEISIPIAPHSYSTGGLKLPARNETSGILESIIPEKLFTFSSTPSIAAGAGAGTSPTVSIAGNNVDGTITITTGTLPTLSAVIATISFSGGLTYAIGSSPFLFPTNSNAQLIFSGTTMIGTVGGTTSWVINAGTTALTGATTYTFSYHVGGY